MPVPPPEAAVWPHPAGRAARLCCCAASRVRHRAGWHLLACCPRRPAWCGAGPAGHEASRRPAGGFAASARAVLAELEARGAARAVPAGRSYGEASRCRRPGWRLSVPGRWSCGPVPTRGACPAGQAACRSGGSRAGMRAAAC